eukprot:2804408-Rhodomonas_salina.2
MLLWEERTVELAHPWQILVHRLSHCPRQRLSFSQLSVRLRHPQRYVLGRAGQIERWCASDNCSHRVLSHSVELCLLWVCSNVIPHLHVSPKHCGQCHCQVHHGPAKKKLAG